jgi:hypothetical protein
LAQASASSSRRIRTVTQCLLVSQPAHTRFHPSFQSVHLFLSNFHFRFVAICDEHRFAWSIEGDSTLPAFFLPFGLASRSTLSLSFHFRCFHSSLALSTCPSKSIPLKCSWSLPAFCPPNTNRVHCECVTRCLPTMCVFALYLNANFATRHFKGIFAPTRCSLSARVLIWHRHVLFQDEPNLIVFCCPKILYFDSRTHFHFGRNHSQSLTFLVKP